MDTRENYLIVCMLIIRIERKSEETVFVMEVMGRYAGSEPYLAGDIP